MTSFAGPYLSCTARALARPSAEERIPFHGYTNMHSTLEFAWRVHCCRRVSTVLLGAVLPSRHSVVVVALGEPAFCAAAKRARV